MSPMISGSGAAAKPFERVMVFVDGAWLREICDKHFGIQNSLFTQPKWTFSHLAWIFIRMFNTYTTNPFQANLIRIYYYDAIVDEADSDYEKQRKYFEIIDDQYAFTVQLRKLIKSSKRGFKQK